MAQSTSKKAAPKPVKKAGAKPAKAAATKSARGAKAVQSAKKPSLHLKMLKPSVNNMTVRVFLRATGLDFAESDVWGSTRSPEFLEKNPAHLTPMIEEKGLPNGALWESCARRYR